MDKKYIVCPNCRNAIRFDIYFLAGRCPECGEGQRCICCMDKTEKVMELILFGGLVFFVPICEECYKKNAHHDFVIMVCLNCLSFKIARWTELEKELSPEYYAYLKNQRSNKQLNFFFFTSCGACEYQQPITDISISSRLN